MLLQISVHLKMINLLIKFAAEFMMFQDHLYKINYLKMLHKNYIYKNTIFT